MSKPIEFTYFGWLCDQIHINYNRSIDKSWNGMLEGLYTKQFVWIISNDDNRVQDGWDLRVEYLHEVNAPMTELDTIPSCSVLEVLIGLSRRVAFFTGDRAEWWAWKLIENLELHKINDPLTRRKKLRMEEILETLIWRNYDRDGCGGFFPLAFPDRDQRKVEIWYQMSSYIDELEDP